MDKSIESIEIDDDHFDKISSSDDCCGPRYSKSDDGEGEKTPEKNQGSAGARLLKALTGAVTKSP